MHLAGLQSKTSELFLAVDEQQAWLGLDGAPTPMTPLACLGHRLMLSARSAW